MVDDQALLKVVQYHFPLTPQPYVALAERLGAHPAWVMERTQYLLDGGTVRAIRAIFEARRLSHRSVLVAAHVPEPRLVAVADHVSSHPGVSHNYARRHHYNLWFTLTVPESTDMGRTISELLPDVDAAQTLLLPALRTFKIDARFALGGDLPDVQVAAPPQRGPQTPFEPTAADRRAICALTRPLPVVDWPFALLAEGAGMTPEDLLDRARAYLDQGVMRRYGAVVNHRQIGFRANGMTCWVVPLQRVEKVGHLFAGFPAVSHCYERPTYPGWPYNLFTMVHGATEDEVEDLVRQMAQAGQIEDYVILYSIREFKKEPVSFFAPGMPTG